MFPVRMFFENFFGDAEYVCQESFLTDQEKPDKQIDDTSICA